MSDKKSKPPSEVVTKQEQKPCGCIHVEYSDGRKVTQPCVGHALLAAANALGAAAEALGACGQVQLRGQAEASMAQAAAQAQRIVKP